MKIRKQQKGFSLAEVIIAILVISMALAAAIPTITNRNAGSGNIWKAGEDSNEISFTGPNLLIGLSRLPLNKNTNTYFNENIEDPNFLPKSDRLTIFKNVAPDESAFKSSHISFFNNKNNITEYAGRLTSDKTNIALGIGSLQSLVPSDAAGKYNTAIGHYSLLSDTTGSYNTALGFNTLRGKNINTAKGNIALGFRALENNEGNNNIAIGSHAGLCTNGNDNIIIGRGAGLFVESQKLDCSTMPTNNNNNFIITTFAQGNLDRFDLKSFLNQSRGQETGWTSSFPVIDNEDNFAIGQITGNATIERNSQGETIRVFSSAIRPIIMQGFTKTKKGNEVGCIDGVCHSKGLVINTDNFTLNTRDGLTPIFSVRNDIQSIFDRPDILTDDKTPPCDGAPICLSKFYTRSATLITNEISQGFGNNEYKHAGTLARPYGYGFDFFNITGTTYNTTSTAWIPNNNYPVYDLYIGSKFYSTEEFETHNKREAVRKLYRYNENNNMILEICESNDSDCFSIDGNTDRLIDVGQRRHTSGLNYAIDDGAMWKDHAAVLNTANQYYSLQIRTVKTAVNFLEEFKENSGVFDYMRDNLDDVIKCIFRNNFNTKEENNTDLMQCASEDSNYSNDPDEGTYYEDKVTAAICSKSGSQLCDPNSFACSIWPFKTFSGCKSDARLKNILGDNTAGLKEIKKLKTYNYTYKKDKAKIPHVGVMAQELKEVFPNGVSKGSDGYYRIRFEDMFYAMVNSVQQLSNKKDELNTLATDYIDSPLSELQKQNEDIKAQNELLKQKNAEIEKRLSALETK